jgi:hypothetical protein
MKKKLENCSYCNKQRKLYRCTGMLSSHCQDCCQSNCSGKKKPNIVDEAFAMAREMGGSSWPSADCTKWAMMNLIVRLVHHFEKECAAKPMSPKRVVKEIMGICGIKPPSKRKILEDAVQKAEAQLR